MIQYNDHVNNIDYCNNIVRVHQQNAAHSDTSFLGALPPFLEFHELLLVLLDHLSQTANVLICLLQEVDQALVLLLINQLTIALLVLGLHGEGLRQLSGTL